MHKCSVIANQVCPEKESQSKGLDFYILCLVWLIVVVSGSCTGWLLSSIYSKPANLLITESGLSLLTGPGWYVSNLWLFIWAVKLISLVQIYFSTPHWKFYKSSIPLDIMITLIFYAEYTCITFIHKASDETFKISGHGLILTMSTTLLLFEANLNFNLTLRKEVKLLCTAMILVSFYTLFWTALAYHSIIETMLGIGIGLSTSYLVYIKLKR